jgi:hypothetical protein
MSNRGKSIVAMGIGWWIYSIIGSRSHLELMIGMSTALIIVVMGMKSD